MARGIKISQLDEFTNSDGSEYLTAVKAGATKKIKIQNIAVDALSVSYDNTISGISAINVKDAIDEVESIKIDNTEKGSANGIAVLGADSKIISSQIPAIAIVDTFVVANQTEQLALSAQQGDIAIRSDEAKTYVHNGGTAGNMTDWDWMQTPASAVLSVNSQTGVVTGLEEVINRQNAISDDDSKYPSSGAVVDYLNTHIAAASAHHDNLSNGLNIIPSTVTTTGNIKINSDLTSVKLLFGTAGDTSLYRRSANVLATDGQFNINSAASTTTALWCTVAGSGWGMFNIRADGKLDWGDGTGPADVNLYRDAANVLKTDDEMRSGVGFKIDGTDNGAFIKLDATTTTGNFLYVDLVAESYARFLINNSGGLSWGSGSAAHDVLIQRNSANQLGLGSGDSWYVDSAANYKYGTTTKYAVYGTAHVRASTSDQRLIDNGPIPTYLVVEFIGGSSNWGLIPITLPVGVTITNFELFGSTTSAHANNRVSGTLYRMTTSGTGVGTMATVSFSNGNSNGSDNTITNPIIDSGYSYYVYLELVAAVGIEGARFRSVRITYTNSNVGQTV